MGSSFDRRQLLNDSEEAQRLVLDGRQSTIWTALPCIVQKVNFAKMTLEAQPAIQGLVALPDGGTTAVNLPLLVDVPIVFPSAGGFTLTLPIAVGDECLVVFASRCIDAWWQSGGIQRPIEMRMHDLSDGFAFLGPHSQPQVISDISDTGAQLRKDDGSSFIELSADGKIRIKGDLLVTGEVVAHSLTTPIHLTTHVHPGVTTGGGSTGAPVG